MKNQDIKELLEHSKVEIENIMKDSASGNIGKVKIKNALENLRSILDYNAVEISTAYKNKSGKKVKKAYFPYGKNGTLFKERINSLFPKIGKILPDIYKLIGSVQPHVSGDDWLYELCKLTNEAKHNGLTKTQTQKSISLRQGNFINIEGDCGQIVLQGNYVNGKRLDDVYIDNNQNVTITRHSGTTQITENNTIKFKDKEYEVGPFLNKCYTNIKELSERIDDLLQKEV